MSKRKLGLVDVSYTTEELQLSYLRFGEATLNTYVFEITCGFRYSWPYTGKVLLL